MRYQIEFAPRAEKQLRKLPARVQAQIADRIDALGTDPRPNGVRKLKGMEELYRIRSGDYRIVYQVSDKRLLILVVKIGDRKDVYEGL